MFKYVLMGLLLTIFAFMVLAASYLVYREVQKWVRDYHCHPTYGAITFFLLEIILMLFAGYFAAHFFSITLI